MKQKTAKEALIQYIEAYDIGRWDIYGISHLYLTLGSSKWLSDLGAPDVDQRVLDEAKVSFENAAGLLGIEKDKYAKICGLNQSKCRDFLSLFSIILGEAWEPKPAGLPIT